MKPSSDNDVTIALQLHGHRHGSHPLSEQEVATVAAICNRLARMLGTLDREGLHTDFEIVQSHCPVDLAALAASPDRVFVEEMTQIIESTDRSTRSLVGSFSSRYLSGQRLG